MKKQVIITIDNKEIEVEEGSNLLQVAKENGFDIPNLCYHRKLSPTGACRLCIVKIEGSKGYVTSCSTSVTDGMKVIAFDDELETKRKYLLKYLLAEHNTENDNTYNDEFLDLRKKYNLVDKENNYPEFWEKLRVQDKTSNILTYDSSKCIKCFRCIKACDEVQCKYVLNMSERGINLHVIAGFNNWDKSECDGCGECIQLCPTGAIVEKPNRKVIDINNIDKTVKTTCPYCGVGCQIDLLIKDNRVVRANGVEGILPNDGRLCVKGRFGYEFISSSKRLTTPLIKVDGEFKEATWDEAISLIASKLLKVKDKYGNDAFAGFASAKCTNEDNYIFQKFVRKIMGTNNIDNCARLCHSSTVAAMMRSLGDGAGSNSIEDYATADCIYVTGNNIIETHPVTATYIKQGKSKGAKIIVVDPRWTAMVKYADVWLQPKIGTDVALLNGLIHIIIKNDLIDREFIEKRVENSWDAFNQLKDLTSSYTPEKVEKITGVPADKLIKAATIYANSNKALITTGMGMSQELTGTHNVFSLINMCLITGNIGKQNAGLNPPRGQNNVQGVSDIGGLPNIYPGYIPVTDDKNRKKIAKLWDADYEQLPSHPGLTSIEIMHAAYDEKIKAMYIVGENPMLTDPNLNHTEEAIKKLDFLVVQDIFHTETTKYADVILPATCFAEKDGTFTNSDRRVSRVRKAVDAPGVVREDWRIIIDIVEKMGMSIGTFDNASDIFDELAKAAPIMAGISYDRIDHEGLQWPCPDKNHPGTSTLFTEKFNTPSGKAILNPVEYVEQKERATKEFPYILNSGRILYHYHSATMSRKCKPLNDFSNEPYVLVNNEDAIKLNIKTHDIVNIFNNRGKFNTVVKVSNEVSAGEIFMPWHFKESLVNKVTRDELDPYSKIAPFKLTAVNIKRVIL